MTPIKKPGSVILGAPPGWDEAAMGPCAGLPVIRSDGCQYSYWAPTLYERALIAIGRPVRLSVASSAHPPVCIDTVRA